MAFFVPLLAASAAASNVGRVVVPFGYAWRFHYGDDPTSPPGAGACAGALAGTVPAGESPAGLETKPG